MKKLVVIIALCALFPSVTLAGNKTTVSVSPTSLALGATYTVTWSNLPNNGPALLIQNDCFSALEVVDLYSQTSWSNEALCSGTNYASIIRNTGQGQVIATTSFIVE